MGCGCVSQHQVMGPKPFLATSDAEFLGSLGAEELKDKKRLLAYFHMINEGQFEVTTAFVEHVRSKGVPHRYRWQAWRALSGWSSLYKPGMYERLAQREPDRKVEDAVQKDLDRTFPKVDEFDAEKKRHLGSVVRAYACLVPQVGYCQGMNFIVGFLLLASGSSHEDAFFLFVQIMAKYRASLLFCEGLPLLKLLTFQFAQLLEKCFPEVHLHFLCHNITPELYVTKWILTVFTQPLSLDAAARVWDVILCDGIEALVLICLASVQLLRVRLLKQETEGILELLSLQKDTIPPTGGEIVQAALKLKLPGKGGLQATLSDLHDTWVQENAEAAADLGRAEIAFCTPLVPSIGLLEPPPWQPPAPQPEIEAAQPTHEVSAGSLVTVLVPGGVAAPAGSPVASTRGNCFAASLQRAADHSSVTSATEASAQPQRKEVTDAVVGGDAADHGSEGAPYLIGTEAKVDAISTFIRQTSAGSGGPTSLADSAGQGSPVSLQSSPLSRGPATPFLASVRQQPASSATAPEGPSRLPPLVTDAWTPPKASPWTSPGCCRQSHEAQDWAAPLAPASRSDSASGSQRVDPGPELEAQRTDSAPRLTAL